MEIKTFEQAKQGLLDKADEVMLNHDYCWIVHVSGCYKSDHSYVRFDIVDEADEVLSVYSVTIKPRDVLPLVDVARRFNESMERGF